METARALSRSGILSDREFSGLSSPAVCQKRGSSFRCNPNDRGSDRYCPLNRAQQLILFCKTGPCCFGAALRAEESERASPGFATGKKSRERHSAPVAEKPTWPKPFRRSHSAPAVPLSRFSTKTAAATPTRRPGSTPSAFAGATEHPGSDKPIGPFGLTVRIPRAKSHSHP